MRLRSPHAGSFTVVVLLAGACALFLLGASCDSGTHQAASPAAAGEKSSFDTIETLPGVDVSSLTANERARWIELVNAQLSPCGEPISVAQCVAESRSCHACVPAARYLVRLTAEGFEPSEIGELYEARYDDKHKLSIPVQGAPVRGAPMAPVTIVEFSDFECPYCGAAHPMLQRLLDEYEGRVKLIFKHYPLDGHKNAAPAARAAAAAQLQGKFWEMADLLFEHQRDLSEAQLLVLAKQAGLDMTQFESDLGSEAAANRVETDKRDGKKLEVAGTPTFFVNGRAYLEPMQNLSKYLDEELAR